MRLKDKNARAARQVESRRVATTQNEAVFAAMDTRASENFFANRGFSTHTIKVLIASGINLPEELLGMTADQAGHITGLGRPGLSEVRAYRKRFLTHP